MDTPHRAFTGRMVRGILRFQKEGCKLEVVLLCFELYPFVVYKDNYPSPVLRIERGTGLFSFLAILSITYDTLYAGHTFALHRIGR